MKIKNLVSLPRGTPLSHIVRQPMGDAFLSPSVYKIYPGIYLSLSPYRPGSLNQDTSGPFVTGIVWAVSDGAVRRALLMEIESDDGVVANAPDDFLPEVEGDNTYGEILKGLKNAKPKVCQEKAAYRIASDGLFIHRMIETERFNFFFRNTEFENSETPYVVVRKLT